MSRNIRFSLDEADCLVRDRNVAGGAEEAKFCGKTRAVDALKCRVVLKVERGRRGICAPWRFDARRIAKLNNTLVQPYSRLKTGLILTTGVVLPLGTLTRRGLP